MLHSLKQIFDKRFLLIALIHWGALLPLELIFFLDPLFNYPPCAILKFVFIAFFWQCLAYAIKNYKNDANYRRYIHFVAVYLGFSIFLLLLTWPGNWAGDEIWVLMRLKRLQMMVWQHFLSNLFYLCGLSLYPNPIAIILLQLLLISLVVGYFVYAVDTVMQHSKWSWLAFLPFTLFPTLIQNLSTYRATLFAYLILFFLVRLLFLSWQGKKVTPASLYGLAIVAALISSWRGEGIYFIVAAPVLFIASFWHLSSRSQKFIFAISTFALSGLIMFSQNALWKNEEDKLSNKLTLYVTPLAELTKHAYEDGRMDLIADVDEVLDIQTFFRQPSGIRAFWDEKLIRPQYYERGDAKLMHAYTKLIAQYPHVFMQERWNNFHLSQRKPISSIVGIFENTHSQNVKEIFFLTLFQAI